MNVILDNFDLVAEGLRLHAVAVPGRGRAVARSLGTVAGRDAGRPGRGAPRAAAAIYVTLVRNTPLLIDASSSSRIAAPKLGINFNCVDVTSGSSTSPPSSPLRSSR